MDNINLESLNETELLELLEIFKGMSDGLEDNKGEEQNENE